MQVRSWRGGKGKGFCKWLAEILWNSISYITYSHPLSHSIHPSPCFLPPGDVLVSILLLLPVFLASLCSLLLYSDSEESRSVCFRVWPPPKAIYFGAFRKTKIGGIGKIFTKQIFYFYDWQYWGLKKTFQPCHIWPLLAFSPLLFQSLSRSCCWALGNETFVFSTAIFLFLVLLFSPIDRILLCTLLAKGFKLGSLIHYLVQLLGFFP